MISSLFAQTEARLGPPPRLDIHGIPNQWELKSPVFTIGIDAWNRNAVVDYFNNEYRTSEGVDAGWTGDMSACLEGTTTVQFRQAVLRRVNYFRGMAGLPADVAFDDALHLYRIGGVRHGLRCLSPKDRMIQAVQWIGSGPGR